MLFFYDQSINPCHLLTKINYILSSSVSVKGQINFIFYKDSWMSKNMTIIAHMEIIYLILNNKCDALEKALKNKNISLRFSDADDCSFLHIAAQVNNYQATEILCDIGCDVNALNRWGETPIDCCKDSKVSKLLKERNSHPGITLQSLNHYAHSCNIKMIRKLFFKYGKYAALYKDYDMKTALHVVSSKVDEKCIEITKILLVNGSDKKAVDRMGWTPAEYAGFTRNTEILKLLLN